MTPATLQTLCKKYSVTYHEPPPAPRITTRDVPRLRVVENAEQAPIGTPGTKISAQQVDVEPNPRYQSYLVRGQNGSPGLYEELYRSEPLILDAVQSHTEVLVSGTWEVQPPALLPEGREEEIGAWCAWQTAQLHALRSGWDRFVEHACSMLIFGFAPMQLVWSDDNDRGLLTLADIRYHEQSIVEEWVFDPTGNELLACNFNPGGDFSAPFTVSTGVDSDKLEDRRLVVFGLNQRGMNVEGISPIRPALHYVTLKQLLMQIAGVMAEKYGVPLAVVFEDASWGSEIVSDEDEEDIQEVYASIRAMRAVDASAMTLPGGIDIKYVAPGQAMPSLSDLVAYCDQMITTPFSNEGSLLGLQSAVGSYALGEVKERDTLRSAPYYARRVAQPLNAVLMPLARQQLGVLPAYPRLVWRMDGLQDQSAWIDDAVKVFGPDARRWPAKAQEVVLEKLSLPPDTFDEQERQEEEGAAPLGLSERPACSCAACTSIENADPLGPLEMADPDYPAAAEAMDRAERDLAAVFKRLGRELQARWKVLIRDNTSPSDVLEDRETIRAEYLPRFTDAALAAIGTLGATSALQLARELGAQVEGFELDIDPALTLLAASVAEEALNRSLGVATDAQVDQERGDRRRTVPVLAGSTLALIASRVVSSAFNAARDQLLETLAERYQQRTRKPLRMIAERSSVLDERTCEVCKGLDGKRVVVGSREYRNLMPPNRCEGRHRCRCVYRYFVDVDALRQAGIV